ncbi:MAG: leucine-rich repeat protein [Clostridia bacterium]|nr:leucine-rich repeat protein [Clostridia bacterium]
MRKWSKFILAIMLVAMALSIFVACSVKEKELSLTFVSDEGQYATTIGIEQAKEILASQPTRDGYVFKGWYLDKGSWTQEVESANVEEIAKDNKTISVYAYWVEIVNKITVSFRDYNGGILLEKDYERTDDQLAKDIASLRPSKRPDDEKFTYTFDKWDCNTDDLTQGYFLATPVYTSELRFFEFNYYVDGELIYTDHVRYGEDADADLLAKPQKPSTDKYDYVFTGWEGNFNNITQDTDVYAKFQENIKKFDVTFNFGNNKSVTRKVNYGANAIAPSEKEVVKPSTAQYTYTFVGWDTSFENIKENTVVNAKYVEQIRMYDVKFFVDNKCIKYLNVAYGSSVEPPSQPIKDLDDGFTYEFIGWDVAFDNIISNLEVHARFNKVSHTYSVDYVNWDGSLLFSENVESGEPSVYGADTPSRQSNDKYDYVFVGWTDGDKLNAITRNMTVQAIFKQQIKTFTVTFNYGDGKKSVFPDIEYGSNLTNSNLVPTNVAKASTAQYEYEFIGWDGTFDNITSNAVINAKYNESVRSYTVKFFVDKTCIKSVSALYGSSVEAPEQPVKVLNDGYTYVFKGWDKDFDNIVESIEINAEFEKIANTFTVQYVNWDGTLLYTDRVETEGKSTYVGETPAREPNDKFTYEFKGWSNADMLESVTQSFATEAIFEEVVRTYTVTFNYGHGLQKVLEDVPYGTNLTESTEIPTNTDKSSTKQYDFTFIDWDKYFGYVSRDMEVNAIYKETLRKYIVTFINNGSAVKSQEVEYGKCPVAPTEMIFKNDTVQWKYTFLGWAVAGNDIVDSADDFDGVDPNESQVEDTVTYTAIYLRNIQRYTVKFFNEEDKKLLIGEITVDYGTNMLLRDDIPTPFKESTPKFDYAFSGWSRDLTFVEANVEVYANYDANIRSYKVTFMNGEDVYEEFTVVYGNASPKPEVDPTKQSTVQYDFVFLGWDGLMSYVEGDTVVTANYRNDLRYYKVTYFNLATYELISTVEMGYGSLINITITRDGYDFDSWYRDPNCNTVFDMQNDFVDGTLMLFGNTVMQGLRFNDNNEIIGYEGTQPNLVIPIAANGRKVSTIKKEAFKGNTVIGSVYIPNTITKVEAYVFSGLNLTESGGIYVQSEKKWTGTPSGWDQYWNRNSLTSFHESDRPVTYGVDGIYTVGDFQYILIADGNTAIVDKFINNNTAKAYISDQFDHQKAYFTSVVETDEKTGQQRDIYTIEYTTTTYSITQIAVSAFEGCSNVATIFIPDTISKVGNYAFSGVTANIYIQRSKPAVGEIPSGWGLYWNSNRSGQEGTRTLYWGVIDMDRVGVFSYIFMADGTAIAVEYNGSTSVTSVDVPGSVVFKDVAYTVTELGDELLANMTLLNTVTLNEGLKKIKSKVFYMDPMLSSVTLPSTLEEIGDYAFLGALALKEIYIPASVKTIGMLVFVGMDNLTIYCGVAKEPTYLPGISGYNPLWDVKLGLSDIGDLTNLKGIAGTLVNPNKHTVIYNVAAIYIDTAKEAGRETNFKYVLFNNNTAKVISSNNTILNVENYEIPSVITYNDNTYTVTAIGAGAFSGNTAIKTLIIPSTVTSIEENAFQGCSKLTIKTAHASKPSGWNNNFNPDGRPVDYNYGVTVEVEPTEEVA